MATVSVSPIHATAASTGTGLFASVARWFNTLGQSIAISRQFAARQAQIEELSMLSDAELSRQGLHRDRIVQHVYADLLAL